MTITQVTDIDQVVDFIHREKVAHQSYTNKLPEDKESLKTFIQVLSKEIDLYAHTSEGDIQMMMVLIPYREDHFKVIGPILKDGYTLDQDTFKGLFKEMTAQFSNETVYYFAYEKENQWIKLLMKGIGASYVFTDYYLYANKDVDASDNQHLIVDYKKAYYKHFNQLHKKTFSPDDMTTDEILASLDEHHKLYMYMSEGLVKGYLYLVIDEETHNAQIKYFSSHSDYRLKGIAFDLIRHAIHVSLNEYDIQHVYFKIRSKNYRLVERFNELGFYIDKAFKKFKLMSSDLEDEL
ncbi:GNAT family N-acetyltransferase [Staphylococcus massiliensis]|uniref:GNAT family acetyltransferase n=1 Tax=Staphylococcus massiliensis S46 TaxID=1229783 RepID=K9ANS5_9STAP|nr:GNAT family N-acetyltransferase [Staphylococcus massiliensis]EKU48934.1 GNAT family acetyltransferase [Staphylococcus massiliensis S46]MCG3399374.1 GNAT family N-acetyltransferase [Staphylococcus massiliensis]MCG3402525.1 GNAT family N-acetyltransferase [Staphylococcus massiliensis]MCG3411511.1 GNAT family N-acetyltransferase [Staphylococcus massiliensis]PNZ98783.1 N-acetyltransferase [Staphylococcus massiliensis CCUG 55927]